MVAVAGRSDGALRAGHPGISDLPVAGSNGLFKSTSDVYTYFDDSADIAMAAPVTLNGITVGKVTHVDLSGSSQPGRVIKVTMEIEDEYLNRFRWIRRRVITAGNLLGTKYINIKKGRSQQIVAKGGELPSQNHDRRSTTSCSRAIRHSQLCRGL